MTIDLQVVIAPNPKCMPIAEKGNGSHTYNVNRADVEKRCGFIAEKLKSNPSASLIRLDVSATRLAHLTSVNPTKVDTTALYWLARSNKCKEHDVQHSLPNFLAGHVYDIGELSARSVTALRKPGMITVANVKNILAAACTFADKQLMVECLNFLIFKTTYNQIESLLQNGIDDCLGVDNILDIAKRVVTMCAADFLQQAKSKEVTAKASLTAKETEVALLRGLLSPPPDNAVKIAQADAAVLVCRNALACPAAQVSLLQCEGWKGQLVFNYSGLRPTLELRLGCVDQNSTLTCGGKFPEGEHLCFNLIKEVISKLGVTCLNCEESLFSKSSLESLTEVLPNNSNISELTFSGNELSKDLCSALASFVKELKALKRINLTDCNITKESFAILSKAFKDSPIESILLSSNPLGDSSDDSIKEVLKTAHHLTTLKLSRTELGAKTFMTIAEELPFIELQTLDLSGNSPGEVGSVIMVKALGRGDPKLANLNLSENSITADFLDWIGEALKSNTHLVSLNLAGNKIDSSGHEFVFKILKMAGANFKILDLSNNQIDTLGGNQIARDLSAIKEHRLAVLNLSGNKELKDATKTRLRDVAAEVNKRPGRTPFTLTV